MATRSAAEGALDHIRVLMKANDGVRFIDALILKE